MRPPPLSAREESKVCVCVCVCVNRVLAVLASPALALLTVE